MRSLKTLSVAVLLVTILATAGACGQEPPSQGEENAGETGETTRGTTGESGGSEQESVAASYAIAQEEIEEAGGEKTVGEYRIGYIVEAAEGWWEGETENLEWREPASAETNHIEILPYDEETGLLIPYMDISLAVLDESGNEVDEQELNFYWSEFVHYANNFVVPESGTYTLRAELGPPDFRRHGSAEGEGKVFTEPVTVEFENVEINTEGE